MWWVVFNYPENCTGAVCALDDAFPLPGNTEAGASVSFAAGRVNGTYRQAIDSSFPYIMHVCSHAI